MDNHIMDIIKKANKMVSDAGTRDPHKIANELGIQIMPVDFKTQKGAYKVMMRNRFIFLKSDLHPVMENIVLFHEIGHDTLHRTEAIQAGGFQEYEANIFASQVSLSDDDVLELIYNGYDTQQIARELHSDINLVALKTDALIMQGYDFRPQEHNNKFLKY